MVTLLLSEAEIKGFVKNCNRSLGWLGVVLSQTTSGYVGLQSLVHSIIGHDVRSRRRVSLLPGRRSGASPGYLPSAPNGVSSVDS